MNFPSLEAMFDPDTGADYAAHFLQSLYAERGDWSAAAGAYHSQTPARAERLPGAVRPHPRRPRRRAAARRGRRAGAAPAAEPAAPRKSRTRLSRGPKIITIAARGTPDRRDAPSEEATLGPRDDAPALRMTSRRAGDVRHELTPQ